MISLGVDNTLKIARASKVGLYLADDEGQEILLPNKYVPREYSIGQQVTVFVYLDHEERPVATTLEPYIYLNEFALLRVNYVNEFGAFLDWGLEKDLFVPFREQARPMVQGKRYLVYLYLDAQTNRLVASSKTNQFLKSENINLEPGQEVDLIVSHITDAGVNVIINETYKGLIYKDDVFDDSIRTGDRTTGYIVQVRPDNKVDVSLRKPGYEGVAPDAEKILEMLRHGRGYLKLHDGSSPEDIRSVLKMSKKTFKKAIGALYRDRMIEIRPDGIYLVK